VSLFSAKTRYDPSRDSPVRRSAGDVKRKCADQWIDMSVAIKFETVFESGRAEKWDLGSSFVNLKCAEVRLAPRKWACKHARISSRRTLHSITASSSYVLIASDDRMISTVPKRNAKRLTELRHWLTRVPDRELGSAAWPCGCAGA
jgi:hypothetical protein